MTKQYSVSAGHRDFALKNIKGFETLASHFKVGEVLEYAIRHADRDEWEVGKGSLLDNFTLTRRSVEASSNGNNPVSFSIGFKVVTLKSDDLGSVSLADIPRSQTVRGR